jgi:hypothetical protein
MKNQFTFLIIGAAVLCSISCKKENKQTTAAIPQLYSGKYLETALRIYKVEGANITSDTTYDSSAFSADDFARFVNGTAYVSSDYSYDPRTTNPRLAKTTSVNLEMFDYSYKGSAYVLSNPQPTLNPGGFYTDTLRSANNNTWIIHTVYVTGSPTATAYVPETVTDAYYAMP